LGIGDSDQPVNCDGFRTPARSVSLQHAPKASRPAFESRQ